jgi:hypothetical protein
MKIVIAFYDLLVDQESFERAAKGIRQEERPKLILPAERDWRSLYTLNQALYCPSHSVTACPAQLFFLSL